MHPVAQHEGVAGESVFTEANTLALTTQSDGYYELVPSPESPELLQFEPEMLDEGLTIQRVVEGDELWDPAERFVYRVFRTAGFCGHSPREWVEETEPWRPGSTLHVVTDENDVIVGVVRSILAPFDGLPASQFTPEIEVREGLLCEIGSLAVQAAQRGLGVANELHKAAFQDGIIADVNGFCFLIDSWMFDFFRDVYGLPVQALAPPRRYMGGDVVPTAMWQPEMLEQVARIRPRFYARFVEDIDPVLRAELDLPIVLF